MRRPCKRQSEVFISGHMKYKYINRRRRLHSTESAENEFSKAVRRDFLSWLQREHYISAALHQLTGPFTADSQVFFFFYTWVWNGDECKRAFSNGSKSIWWNQVMIQTRDLLCLKAKSLPPDYVAKSLLYLYSSLDDNATTWLVSSQAK